MKSKFEFSTEQNSVKVSLFFSSFPNLTRSSLFLNKLFMTLCKCLASSSCTILQAERKTPLLFWWEGVINSCNFTKTMELIVRHYYLDKVEPKANFSR